MSTSTTESCLVIGGCGFLGRNVVNGLLDRGSHRVAVFDIVKPSTGSFPTSVKVFEGDLTNQKSLEDAIYKSGATCVFHTASPEYTKPAPLHWKVNVEGTKTVINACIAAHVRVLVYTSSSGVAFNGHHLINADERTPYPKPPLDSYNETKAIADDLITGANGNGGLLTVSIRPSGIFGPGAISLMSNMADVANSMKVRIQIGDNTNLVDWTFVSNVVDAHLIAADKLLDEKSAGEVGGQAFYITNDQPIPFWNFARSVQKHLGKLPSKPPIVISRSTAMILAWFSETVNGCLGREASLTRYKLVYTCCNRYYNIEKAKRLLGYQPKVSLEEGVQKMVEWWNTRQLGRQKM